MMVPTIHDNGTSRERLITQLTAVAGHLDAAFMVLLQAAPNARDYYPQGPRAMEQASNEHGERIKAVLRLRDEIEVLTLAIADAEGPR